MVRKSNPCQAGRHMTLIDKRSDKKYAHDWREGKKGALYVIHKGRKVYSKQLKRVGTLEYVFK